MGRTRTQDSGIGYEPLLARCTYTETGYPASLKDVRAGYGPTAYRSPRDGWFWIGATERSAADIRRRGLRAVGTLVTTWVPPQTAAEIDETVREEDVPAVGTQAHADLMLAETRARERAI